MADTFNALVRDVLRTRVPHRLLCVFVETKTAVHSAPLLLKTPPRDQDQAHWLRVCTSAHMPITPELSFALLRETADTHDPAWATVFVAACHNPDRTMPSELQANAYLANMRERLLAGDRVGLIEIDREGKVVFHKQRGQLVQA